MGRKHERDRTDPRKINVEIAPGNQAAMDRYIAEYNHRPDRATPKVGYTDVVNEALDRFLRAHRPSRSQAPESSRRSKTAKG